MLHVLSQLQYDFLFSNNNNNNNDHHHHNNIQYLYTATYNLQGDCSKALYEHYKTDLDEHSTLRHMYI